MSKLAPDSLSFRLSGDASQVTLPSYTQDIDWLDKVLSEGFPCTRQAFSRRFLRSALMQSANWGSTFPMWFAFYAEHWIADNLRRKRLQRLEKVLSSLKGLPGYGGSRKNLEARVRYPGFQGSEAFFEVAILGAAISLRPEFSIEVYPLLENAKPEFSAKDGGRTLFFEASCFRMQGKSFLPSIGEILTSIGITNSRVENKLQDKKCQLSPQHPNVLIIGHMSFDPKEEQEDIAQTIADAINAFPSESAISAALVLWYSSLSDPVLIRTEYFSRGELSLTTQERELIGRLEACFEVRKDNKA